MEPVEKFCIDLPLSPEVSILHQIFTEAEANLYVVGGYVRDFYQSIIKGKDFTPKDIDLVTELHPESVIDLLKNKIKIKEVGKSFGVILATVNEKDFEIATFREDAKTSDGRRPDYVTFSTIDKDAARRDLTINALYYDINNKVIIDFFGGLQDLNRNIVRFVGDAIDRIREDKLRVMRFVRFHCRTNSKPYEINKDTRDVIRGVNLRPEISNERIRDEFIKSINSCLDIQNYLLDMDDLGLLKQVLPGMCPNLPSKLDVPLEHLIAQILRSNDERKVKNKLLELKYTYQEAINISFLVGLPQWKDESQFVQFKKAYQKTTLSNFTCNGIVSDMLLAPFPTVRGEEVIEETGLDGKDLGDEINRREIERFKEWRSNLAKKPSE